MHLASLLFLATASVSVAAHPGHHHAHARFHEKRDMLNVEKRDDNNMIYATINGKVVSWTQGGSPFMQAHRPTPLPDPPSQPADPPAQPTPNIEAPPNNGAAGGDGQGPDSFEPFGQCGGVRKRATAAQIAYKGNLGTCGYGTNIKLVKSNYALQYQYTIKVVGGGQPMQCKAWNKIGRDGGINGFFTGNEAAVFDLPPGGIQYLAFDQNSQGGLTCFPGAVPTTQWGQLQGPWAEFDFGNDSNGDWSGFDASQLVAGATGGAQNGLKLCTADNSVCSTLFQGGGGTNAFLPGMEALDGLGGNMPPGPLHLVAQF